MGKRVDPLTCGRPAGNVCDLDCANCDLGPIQHLADHGQVYVHTLAQAEEIKAAAPFCCWITYDGRMGEWNWRIERE